MNALRIQVELTKGGVVFERCECRETGKTIHIAFLDGVELDRSRYLGELIKTVAVKLGETV